MNLQSSTNTFLAGVLVIILLVATKPYQTSFDKITVREFEVVDDSGKKRASIKIEPGGEVVFRLMDKTGTIRVKMGAGEDGSGLVLLDDQTNPRMHALAKKSSTTLTITDADGKKREY